MTRKPKATEAEKIFAGGGEMGALMRSHDWSRTPLGAVESWPQSLRTAVSICLNSRFPMVIWWSEELILLYNDAWRPILGAKYPQSLGKPGQEVWPEIWDTIGTQLNSVLTTGQATWSDDLLLLMERYGYREEAYFTYSYSPIFLESGEVGGAFTAVTETTGRVIGERRLDTLRELAANTGKAKSVEETCRIASNTLAQNPYDIPLALLYLVENEGQQARLVGTSGIASGTLASLEQIDLTRERDLWDLNQVKKTGSAELVNDLIARFGSLSGGVWGESTRAALVMPLKQSGQKQQLAGLLVLGISPRREFDDEYRGFFDLVASQITTAIANARVYEEERKQVEALAELDQAKTVFFSNVSHEFRTPLTLLLSPLEELLVVADDVPLATVRQSLELMHRNGLRLLKLVNTLLEFSRIEAGRIEANYEPTDLAALTRELASVFDSVIERVGMRLQVDCPPLPEPIYVDRQMWEKIVLNLLSNAFKFTFAGEITVSLRLAGEQALLSIQDTGIGIPSAELPHLFERFHRVKDARGRTFEGSGIGLSLVQELVLLHGGTVKATSTLGQGSCFTVSIPTGYAHLPPDRISATRTLQSTDLGAASYVEEVLRWLPQEESQKPSCSPLTPDLVPQGSSRSSTRILVVDDNADMRNYVKRLLSERYEVEFAINGIAALASIRQQLPDLVLTDVMMPELDGFELLKELRADPNTIRVPVILLSARAGEESRVEGLEAGADDYLLKPFSARELLARVEGNLKMARLRQESYQREQALRIEAEAATEQLENVLSRIDDQFLALDREGRYIYINDSVSRVMGMPKEELLGRSIWEAFPDLSGSHFYKEVQRAMAEQAIVHFEYFYAPWQRWFENHVYPSADGVSIFSEEITDRKQVENALRESDARLRLALEVGCMGTFDWNMETGTVIWSEGHYTLFGLSPNEVTPSYQIWAEHVHPDDLPRVEASVRRAIEEHTEYREEYRVIGFNGTVHWIEGRGQFYYRDNGQCSRMLGVIIDIDDRKQVEETLARREAELRLVTDTVPALISFVDVDQRYRFNNRGYEEWFGHPTAEFYGKHIREVLDETAYEAIRPYVEQVLAGESVTFESQIPYKEGGTRYVSATYVPQFNSQGTVEGFVVFVNDISDRHQAEAALRDSEIELQRSNERFEQAAMAVNCLIYDWNVEQDSVFRTEGLTRILGYSLEEAESTGEWWRTLIHPEDFPRVQAETSVELQCGDRYSTEFRVRHKNGRYVYVQEQGIVSKDANGNWLRVVGSTIDISDRKQAEATLREKELFLQNLTNNVPVMLWTALPDGTMDFVSQPWIDYTGMDLESVNWQGWQALIYPDDFAETLKRWNHAARTGQPYEITHRVRRADGQYRWCISRAVLTRDEQLNPLRWVGSAVDIEHQKQVELTLIQTTELLEKRNQELDRFAYIVSHDLKAPLRAITNLSQWLEDDLEGQLPEENQQQMRLLRQRGYRLEALIDGLLAYSRADRTQAVAERVDVGELIAEVIDSLAPPPGFRIEVQPGMPQIITKRILLSQVFANLIGNAIKHHDRADGQVEISVRRPGNHYYEFVVNDDGPGIAPEYHEKIFDIFQTLKARDVQENTGIGLSIVKKIIETEEGEIRLESDTGKGATFRFTWLAQPPTAVDER